jgi:hypothetical protein
MKLSFKKQPKETGLSAVGNPYQSVDIKGDKKLVGTIYAPNWRTKTNEWSIGLMVIDKTQHCGWKWITLKFRGTSDQECRDWLKENWEAIQAKYSLRQSEH